MSQPKGSVENVSEVTTCWNTIGVWGTQSPRCEKLQDVIHCRNCKTYWDAGRDVFDKEIPLDYLSQWTQTLAGIPESRSSDTQSIIYFRLGEEWFSLSTNNFVEVSQIKSIHNIPHQKGKVITGLVNVGGSVRLCFSLSKLLGVAEASTKQARQHGVYQRYLVVQISDSDYVFPVDEVGGVHRYDPAELKQVPVTIEPEKAALLLGVVDIEGNHVACIDEDKLAFAFEGVANG